MIKESFKWNHDKFLLDYETELIMDCLNPLADSFEKCKGKDYLD